MAIKSRVQISNLKIETKDSDIVLPYLFEQIVPLTEQQDKIIKDYITECKSSLTKPMPMGQEFLYSIFEKITETDPCLEITLKCPYCTKEITFREGELKHKHDKTK